MWTLEAFDTMDADAASRILLACCASNEWAERLVAARPYKTRDALESAALQAFDDLDDTELAAAKQAHPRIGGPVTGDAWSGTEQSRAQSADPAVRAALAEANAVYERRFGGVFLICATGLTAERILTELGRRLGNDEQAEAAESTAELRKIVALRLAKAFGERP